jgi:hypothetical protein
LLHFIIPLHKPLTGLKIAVGHTSFWYRKARKMSLISQVYYE